MIKSPAIVPDLILHRSDRERVKAEKISTFLASPDAARYTRYGREFIRWCTVHNECCPPQGDASDAAIATHLLEVFNDPTSQCNAVGSLRTRYTAIRSLHVMNGFSCGNTGLINVLFKKLQKLSPPLKRRTPLTRNDIIVFCRFARAEPSATIAARNEALILTLFDSGLRASEGRRLRIEDLMFLKRELQLRILDSKCNKGGPAEFVWIQASEDPLQCALVALQKYLAIADISGGFVFRGTRGGALRDSISTQTITVMVQRYARMAGLRGDYGAHSFRRGCATTAHKNNTPTENIQTHLRHDDRRETMQYIDASAGHHRGIPTVKLL